MKKWCKSRILSFICLLACTILLSPVLLAQNVNDLIISEIMADPTPTKGLPEKEYIELYNRTDKVIDLNRFRLSYQTTTVTFPSFLLQPKSYVIVTSRANEADFKPYGNVVALSSLSLLNTGTTLTLKNSQNKTIFSVTYSDKWYEKGKEQGFSLEMIDTSFPCVEDGNWSSCLATLQGTPAKENSVKASKPDLTPPSLSRFEMVGSNTIKLIFSEKLDSLSAVSMNAYSFDKDLQISTLKLESPQNKSVNLGLTTALQDNTLYTLTIKNLADCSGNVMLSTQAVVGNLKLADSGDVVLNEVLFNPRSGGEDFVEIYNRTEKLISLKNWSLANIDDKGKMANIKTIATSAIVIQPKQFLVLCRTAVNVQNQYYKSVNANFLEVASMPSFPDDDGSVILLNETQKVFDRFDYSEKMHHPLIDIKEGVSLEKIDYNKSSADPNNWQSAASSEGFATPGYANSQSLVDSRENIFKIEPEVFSPDGDGQDEATKFSFQLDQGAYVANIQVFDANGRLVRQLAQNQLLGVNNSIEWDGKTTNNEVVPVGYYILLAELFDVNGEKKHYKGKVVVGSRF
ncbi:flagellar hook capping protein [Emticicia oligotrophica DSM 17448]|uniref:Flagellar hook capping protein n=1 Tax=Emticicia oligotrophica (strain DSM 17448 / CIP 109782 / MTCC 6937 / GPTSA100-15) TaxID=929562 RepID=A0ABN4ACK2_EMTOG|nr:lamin tail domain-containing protein [Emticicia oligotrophica]AFK01985.1 flagellar hook capping protein [Emticicia oligotrophica DSM 17448]